MNASVTEARPLVSLGSNGKALTSWDMEDLSLEQQERILTLGRKLDLVTRHLLWHTKNCFVCSLLKEGGWWGGVGAAVVCRRRQDGYWSLLKTKYGSICKCFPQENEQGWIISAVVVPNFFRGRKFEGKQTFLVVAVIFYLLIVARCSRIGTFFVCLFVLAFREAKGFARNLSREGRTLRSNSFLKQILVWFSFLYKSVTTRNGFLRWWFFFLSGLRACTEAVQNFSNILTTVWSHGPDSKSMIGSIRSWVFPCTQKRERGVSWRHYCDIGT